MATWSTDLSGCQSSADRGLAFGRDAQGDLRIAQSQLHTAQADAASAQAASATVSGTAVKYASAVPPAGVTVPDTAAVAAAARRATAAGGAVSSAQGGVDAAQGRIDAAKRMVNDAVSLRDERGRVTAGKLRDAADAGIPPDSFWKKVGDALGKAWHVVVEVAKVVVLIGGIVALIVGGPLAWIVFAAAVLILVDTAVKYAQGRASLLDVGLALLSCIPCTKGLTTLGEMSTAFKAGGTLGAGAHLLGAAKQAGIGVLRTAQQLRQGSGPAVTAIVHGLAETKSLANGEAGLTKFSALFGGVNDARKGAYNAAWADHVAQVGETDPARAATLWQGHGSYPGSDRWRNEVLSANTPLEAGYPGVGGFVVPGGTFESVGHDAAAYAGGVQVGPSGYSPPLRSQGLRFETQSDVSVASSTAHANPQYGPGNRLQHYIPDFTTKVVGGQINALDSAGVRIPASLDGRGTSPSTYRMAARSS